MTVDEMAALFEKHGNEYLQHDAIKGPRDVFALLLLDAILPRNHNLITGAGHDEIWMRMPTARVAEVIKEAQIIVLLRCGVQYDTGKDAFHMFV